MIITTIIQAPAQGAGMVEKPTTQAVPLGQRLLDRPFLLLVLGLAVMVIFYTGWGLLEILSLTPSPLP